MKGYALLLLTILFYCSPLAAQTGCLVNTNSTVYTVQDNSGIINAVLAIVFGGNPVYQASPNEPSVSACIANSQKIWTPTTQNCTVCPLGYSFNFLGVVTGCETTTYIGKVANSSVVYCNLDDYSWTLGAAAGLFGVFIIRRRNKL